MPIRYWLILLTLALWLPTAKGQNLTWLRIENPDNSSFLNAGSRVLQILRDDQGDVYTLTRYSDYTAIYDDDQFTRVFTDPSNGYLMAKYSPAGELLWYKTFNVFSVNPKMNVSPDGRVILAGKVSEFMDFDFDFEGERFVTEQFVDTFFFVWMDTDGNVTNWELSTETEGDFGIEKISGVLLLDDGRFWLSGGFIKTQAVFGQLRHDIEFVNLIGTDGKVVKSNLFDAGPHANFPTRWFNLDDFQQVNGKIYMRASGNGFYGLSRGDIFARESHEYVLSINGANEIDLEFSIEDVEDNVVDMAVHNDGSFSVIGSALDGVLNTSIGDISIDSSTGSFLANIRGSSLLGSIPVPGVFLRMRKFENDDERLVVYGSSGLPVVVPDGQGNDFTTTSRQFIGFYKRSGVLTFVESFDEISPDASVFLDDVMADANCNALYLGGYSIGVVDYDLSDEAELLSSGVSDRIGYLFGKYNNERPQIVSPDTLKVCAGAALTAILTIIDEASDLLTLTFSAPNGDFDPGLISTTGVGINRFVDFSNLGVTGDILVRIRAMDVCGDFNEKDILIQSTPAPEAPLLSVTGQYYLCPGDILRLTSNATNAVTWSDGSTSDTLEITGAGLYSQIQTSETGCSSVDSEVLTVVMAELPEVPVISASGPLEICQGESVTLTSSLTENVIWSTGETTAAITVSDPGVYTVYQTSEHCGNSELSLPIEVVIKDTPPQPLITIEGDSRFCEGGAVVLRASEADTYLWSTGATTREISVNSSGSFWLSSTVNGCESPASDVVDILVDEDFDLFLAADTSVCSAFNTIELIPEASLPGLDYQWSDGSAMNTLQIDEAGNYWVEVSNGTCAQRAFVRVEEVCYPILYVPTAFSPNDDGTNDTFKAKGTRIINFGMSIFNQWGIKIFSSGSLDVGWDGMFDNEEVPEGLYVYHIVYSGIINDKVVNLSKRGGVSLLR